MLLLAPGPFPAGEDLETHIDDYKPFVVSRRACCESSDPQALESGDEMELPSIS